ncbi:MAG: hypothetical protein KF794_06405 [Xanthobacteraceae bacterium]|nr:hypothetical protein [Xanthobacteraceae bacterium]QYK46302.1 MAG: hypothetical protein KF794_06405 [Xanthobacteraceae bacterium]
MMRAIAVRGRSPLLLAEFCEWVFLANQPGQFGKRIFSTARTRSPSRRLRRKLPIALG